MGETYPITKLIIEQARWISTDETASTMAALAASQEWKVERLELGEGNGYLSDLKGAGLRSL